MSSCGFRRVDQKCLQKHIPVDFKLKLVNINPISVEATEQGQLIILKFVNVGAATSRCLESCTGDFNSVSLGGLKSRVFKRDTRNFYLCNPQGSKLISRF